MRNHEAVILTVIGSIDNAAIIGLGSTIGDDRGVASSDVFDVSFSNRGLIPKFIDYRCANINESL